MKGKTMGRYQTTIIGTISTVNGFDADGNVVVGLAARGVRALALARTLLLRLTGMATARLHSAFIGPMPAVAAAGRILRQHRLSTPGTRCRWLSREPGAGAAKRS